MPQHAALQKAPTVANAHPMVARCFIEPLINGPGACLRALC